MVIICNMVSPAGSHFLHTHRYHIMGQQQKFETLYLAPIICCFCLQSPYYLLSSISPLPLVFHLPSTFCLQSPYLLSSISLLPLVFHLPSTFCLPSPLYLLSSISLLPLVFGFLLLSLPPPISLLLIQCKEHYLPHDGLEKGFPLLLAVLRVEFDLQFLNHLGRLVFLEVHDGIKHLERGRIGREGGGGRGEKERFAKALILYYGGFPLIRRH